VAQFTVRVELHGAIAAQYDLLHQRMEAAGFSRFIPGIDASGAAGLWQLPTAEYNFVIEENAQQVRERAKLIADSVALGAWVLVTQVADRSWTTMKVQSA
jgi:hypothetical protein